MQATEINFFPLSKVLGEQQIFWSAIDFFLDSKKVN